MDIKSAYNKVQKKYSLPSYEELDHEFEFLYVNPIMELPPSLRFMRRRINDKIYVICNMIQAIIQPNPSSFVNMQEASMFSKEDKEQLSELLKECMQRERKSLLLDMDHDEKKDAEFIKESYTFWKKKKKEIVAFTQKLEESWTKEETKGKNKHYFG